MPITITHATRAHRMPRIHEDTAPCPCGIRHHGPQRVVTYQGAHDPAGGASGLRPMPIPERW